MNGKFYWLCKPRVLYILIANEFTAADVADTKLQVMPFLEESQQSTTAPHRVHLIIDAVEVVSHSGDVRQLVRSASWMRHSDIGWICVVNVNGAVMKVVISMMQVFGVRLRLFDTMAHALVFLNMIDPTLPPLSADALQSQR